MIQSDSRSIPIKVRTGMNLSNHQVRFTNRPDALNVENVSKMYLSPAGELTALKEISFSVKKGELVSIVGPSGSGKSTLLNIIGALDKPTSGNVLVDEIDIFALPGSEISDFRNRMIGFIFQSYNLINRTSIQKNIEIPGIISGMSKTERKWRSINYLISWESVIKPIKSHQI